MDQVSLVQAEIATSLIAYCSNPALSEIPNQMFTMLKMLNSKLEYSVLKDYFSESLSVEVSKYQSSQKDDEKEKQIEKIIIKLHYILSRNSYNDELDRRRYFGHARCY